MTITALPAAPSTADPANFNTKADAFIAALGTFVTEANAVAAAMNLNSTTDTSASSVLIGTGAKTFTVTAGKSFQPGMYLVIADTAAPSTNSMYGQVTSYGTTSLVMNITGVVGSGTKTAWTISQSASNAYAATATTATNTGGNTTIASATTPDIFATTVGTIVDYTGTATCTGFVAAPQAGATKRLICAGACLFTAGANLLIQGIPSGITITLGANAIVDVTALTTTQFKMTYSLSGTFTVTGTGFTINPTATAVYKVENGFASVRIPYNVLSGTSNATTFTLTGLPASLMPISTSALPIMGGKDNGVSVYIFGEIVSANTITLGNGHQGVAWTASNGKGLYTSNLSWSLA